MARRRSSRFAPQKGELVSIVLYLLLDADAFGMAAGDTVVQQNGPTIGRDGLQLRHHFARVHWIHACVAFSGEEQDRGIVDLRSYIVVWRVFEEIRKLLRVIC